MSNNPEKVQAVQSAGIEVSERVPAEIEAYESHEKYLRTKREKMGHLFYAAGIASLQVPLE